MNDAVAETPDTTHEFGLNQSDYRTSHWEGGTPLERHAETLPKVDLLSLKDRVSALLTAQGWSSSTSTSDAAKIYPGEAVPGAGAVEKHFAKLEAEGVLRDACKQLGGMAPGTGRGSVVFHLGSDLSPLIAGGVLARDDVESVLRVGGRQQDFDRGLSSPQDPTKNRMIKH